MNITERLRNSHALSSNERLIADFLLNETPQAVKMSYRQVAEACHTSVSCIYRLCQKMQVTGFNEMKVLLSKELNEELSRYQELDFNLPFSAGDEPQQVIRSLTNIYKQTIDDTVRMLDVQQLSEISALLKRASAVYFIASGENLLTGQSLRQKFQEIGIPVQLPMEFTDGRLFCSGANSASAAIFLSYAGISNYMLECVRELYQRKARIILITSRHDKKLHYYADYRLMLCGKENPSAKIAGFSSQCSAQFLCDLLFSLYYQKDYKKNWLARKKKTYLL